MIILSTVTAFVEQPRTQTDNQFLDPAGMIINTVTAFLRQPETRTDIEFADLVKIIPSTVTAIVNHQTKQADPAVILPTVTPFLVKQPKTQTSQQ